MTDPLSSNRRRLPAGLRKAGLIAVALSVLAVPQALAQGTAAPASPQSGDPPYEGQLLRLSEILGALHYLRPLCGAVEGQLWRQQMEDLIAAEEPSDQRRARLTDRFNLGYSTFASVYRTCTSAASLVLERYQKEGAQIARDITARYGR